MDFNEIFIKRTIRQRIIEARISEVRTVDSHSIGGHDYETFADITRRPDIGDGSEIHGRIWEDNYLLVTSRYPAGSLDNTMIQGKPCLICIDKRPLWPEFEDLFGGLEGPVKIVDLFHIYDFEGREISMDKHHRLVQNVVHEYWKSTKNELGWLFSNATKRALSIEIRYRLMKARTGKIHNMVVGKICEKQALESGFMHCPDFNPPQFTSDKRRLKDEYLLVTPNPSFDSSIENSKPYLQIYGSHHRCDIFDENRHMYPTKVVDLSNMYDSDGEVFNMSSGGLLVQSIASSMDSELYDVIRREPFSATLVYCTHIIQARIIAAHTSLLDVVPAAYLDQYVKCNQAKNGNAGSSREVIRLEKSSKILSYLLVTTNPKQVTDDEQQKLLICIDKFVSPTMYQFIVEDCDIPVKYVDLSGIFDNGGKEVTIFTHSELINQVARETERNEATYLEKENKYYQVRGPSIYSVLLKPAGQ